jgi:hypothetical protein
VNSVPANLLKNFWISFTVASLLILSTSQLMIQYGDFANAKLLSRFCFVLLCVCIAPLFQLREWILVLVSFALLIGLYPTQTGQFDILFALDKAAFFAAFIYLVTLLKEAAVRSNSVLKLGTYLTQQPSGRRYFSIAFGGHILGVLLNFGAISLLMPLIQRGTKTAKTPAHSAILEQQQISALLRGFSWMIMWSPTALTQAVLFTAFPQIDLTLIISLGIGSTLVMILLGRIEDRIRWRNTKLPVDTKQQAFPSRSAVRFSVICISLIGFTVSVVVIANVSAAIALMLIAPFVMTLWLFAQQYDKHVVNALKGTAKTLTTILNQSSKMLGRSAVTLGAAGFIGEAAARVAPVDALATYLEVMNIPSWALLISLPIIITLCGQIALSPILVVVFLSPVLNQLPILPADPNLIVFALGAGWALSMTASPNASATLLISSASGIAPTTLTWRWNGIYALMCFALFSLDFIALASIY